MLWSNNFLIMIFLEKDFRGILERDMSVALELWLTANSPAINFVIFLRRLYRRMSCFIGNNMIADRALVFYGRALSILSLSNVLFKKRLLIFSSDCDIGLKIDCEFVAGWPM